MGFIKKVKKSVAKFVTNPDRVLAAGATLGASEGWRALDGAAGSPVRGMLSPGGDNAADGMRSDEERAQWEIQNRINQLRANYGEGVGPDAQAAQAGINRFIGQLSGDSTDAAIAEAGDAYQGDTRSIEEATTNAGLQGGTADLDARRQALEGFVRRRQQIASAASAAGEQTRNGMQQERMGLEREIAKGTRADPSWDMTAGQRRSQLAGAWQQSWQQQLGVLADGAGAGIANGIRNASPAVAPADRLKARQQSNADFFNNARE